MGAEDNLTSHTSAVGVIGFSTVHLSFCNYLTNVASYKWCLRRAGPGGGGVYAEHK